MDFLNPEKERRSHSMLILGYALVALAIGIATLVLLYQSYGYSINKKGDLTQSGLVFVSSQPKGSTIYLNGSRYKSNTNTRLVLPAGSYNMQITAAEYRGWQRQIVVGGGDVQHYDYPFLFPKKLTTSQFANLSADPAIATQSPDKRWLLLGESDNPGKFIEYDFKAPNKPVQSELPLPIGSYTAGDGTQAWSLVEWAADNRHVLLLHSYTIGQQTLHEYILVDRDTPVDSINLSSSLKLSQTEVLSLFNKKVDQFYLYDSTAQTLKSISADNTSTLSQLDHVLAFKTYGDNAMLYVTDKSPTGKASANQVSVIWQTGSKVITLRTLPVGATSYALDMAQYSGDWYVAVGASTDTSVYLYKNPQYQPNPDSNIAVLPEPWRRLLVAHPTFVGFSSNTQFLVAENAQQFAVYDAENVATYRYTTSQPIDQPQSHANWMDGDRLMYVSGGKLTVFDYDYRNVQTLQAASAVYLPAFASDYSYLYSLRSLEDPASKAVLDSTPLTVPPK